MSDTRRILSRGKDGQQRRTVIHPTGEVEQTPVTNEQVRELHGMGYELLDDGIVNSLVAYAQQQAQQQGSPLGEALRQQAGAATPQPRFMPGATSVALENQKGRGEVNALVAALMRSRRGA